MLSCAVSFAAEVTQDPQQNLTQVRAAIEEIRSWLEQANENQSEQQLELKQAELRLSRSHQNLDTLQLSHINSQQELARLELRTDSLRHVEKEQSRLAEQAIRAAYMAGNESLLKLILNQQDISQASTMVQYYRYFNAATVQTLQQYRETLAELTILNQQLSDQTSDLQDQQDQLNIQLQSLNQEQSQREQVLSQLQSTLSSRSGELEQLVVNRDELELLIEQINQVVESIPSPSDLIAFEQLKGQLAWPGQGPLRNSFGASYGNGSLQRHGVIIDVAAGTEVAAIHAGRIVFADWLRGLGLLVIIDHGEGFMSLYGYNQSIAKTAGSWVNAGEKIALAGNSGGQEQSGIYFEIRHHGQAQDPINWCLPR